MENPPRKKPTKKSISKPKKTNPVKVVYISNPMKVKTCASRFRSLVQELTGQDAELPDPTKFPDGEDVGFVDQTVPDAASDDHGVDVVPTVEEGGGKEKAAGDDGDGDGDGNDDVFSVQLLENLAPSWYYESVCLDIKRDSGNV